MKFDKLHEELQTSELKDITCRKFKKAAVIAALDITLTRVHRSPERCARNLLEIGTSAFPNKLTRQEQATLLQELLLLCRKKDIINIRNLFLMYFFE